MGAVSIEYDSYILTGKTIKNGFGLIESNNGKIDFSIIYDLITKGDHHGKIAYVIRDYVPKQWTNMLVNNFDLVLEKRGSHRINDGFVSVQQIGSSQFAKTGSLYMKETQASYNDIDQLFDDIPPHIVDELFLDKYLEKNLLNKNIHFGSSHFKSGHAPIATFRRWLDNGVMSLMPHEDKAQLAYAAKDNFEIHKASIVIAQNLCVESTGKGGELTVWNIQPDDQCRKNFGVLETGYPYPPNYLKNVEKIEINLNPGDMYFMNGCCIHGVKNVVNGKRLTAGRFIGSIPHNKVVYWT